MRVVTIKAVKEIRTADNTLLGYEAHISDECCDSLSQLFDHERHKISHERMMCRINEFCNTSVLPEYCVENRRFTEAGIQFLTLDIVPVEILDAIINETRFSKYTFASESTLKLFDVEIVEKYSKLDVIDFNSWWRNYAADKRWNEGEVYSFIRESLENSKYCS